MNIGILGTGSIAEKMSATINKMNNAHLYAVASRTAEKAKSFSENYIVECVDYLEQTNVILKNICENYEVSENMWK